MLLPSAATVVNDALGLALNELQPAHLESLVPLVLVVEVFAGLQVFGAGRRAAVGVVLRVADVALKAEHRRSHCSQQQHPQHNGRETATHFERTLQLV